MTSISALGRTVVVFSVVLLIALAATATAGPLALRDR